MSRFELLSDAQWLLIEPMLARPTVWTWHHRMAIDGTWDRVVSKPTTAADAAGLLVDWSLSVDSAVARAHQHATNTTRTTGGWIELHESAGRAA